MDGEIQFEINNIDLGNCVCRYDETILIRFLRNRKISEDSRVKTQVPILLKFLLFCNHIEDLTFMEIDSYIQIFTPLFLQKKLY